MSDFLRTMAASSAKRAAAAKHKEPESALLARALETRDPVEPRLHQDGFDIIAEIKRRSPSAGVLVGDEQNHKSILKMCAEYQQGGAAAVSVLTEPDEFHGSLSDLASASRATELPVMRKDFLVDPYQVLEARAEGAAGVLLILRILDDHRVSEMLRAIFEMHLFVLLEVFDSEDLARARSAADLSASFGLTAFIGVNSRDLTTLRVDPDRLHLLSTELPESPPCVAESGINSEDDAIAAARLGYSLALVGSSLVKSGSPATMVSNLLDAGRRWKLNHAHTR